MNYIYVTSHTSWEKDFEEFTDLKFPSLVMVGDMTIGPTPSIETTKYLRKKHYLLAIFFHSDFSIVFDTENMVPLKYLHDHSVKRGARIYKCEYELEGATMSKLLELLSRVEDSDSLTTIKLKLCLNGFLLEET